MESDGPLNSWIALQIHVGPTHITWEQDYSRESYLNARQGPRVCISNEFSGEWGPDVRPTLRVADICALPSKGQFRDIIDPGIPGSIEEA